MSQGNDSTKVISCSEQPQKIAYNSGSVSFQTLKILQEIEKTILNRKCYCFTYNTKACHCSFKLRSFATSRRFYTTNVCLLQSNVACHVCSHPAVRLFVCRYNYLLYIDVQVKRSRLNVGFRLSSTLQVRDPSKQTLYYGVIFQQPHSIFSDWLHQLQKFQTKTLKILFKTL